MRCKSKVKRLVEPPGTTGTKERRGQGWAAVALWIDEGSVPRERAAWGWEQFRVVDVGEVEQVSGGA